MTYKKGNKPHSNAGRKPGTLNKRTQSLIDVLESKGYSPLADLIEWAAIARKEFDKIIKKTESQPESPFPSNASEWVKLGVACATSIMPYCHARLKPSDAPKISEEDLIKMTDDQLIQTADDMLSELKKAKHHLDKEAGVIS